MKMSRARVVGLGCFRAMDRSRWPLAGPQIAAQRVEFVDWPAIRTGLGVRERRRLATSFAAGCWSGLRFRVGVVDPGAKRRIWD